MSEPHKIGEPMNPLEMYRRLQMAEGRLHNLLARIHRDGGHYTEEHGVEKACRDADLRVAEAYGRIAELEVALRDACIGHADDCTCAGCRLAFAPKERT